MKFGDIFTLEEIFIRSFDSEVELQGIDDCTFNTILTEDVKRVD